MSEGLRGITVGESAGLGEFSSGRSWDDADVVGILLIWLGEMLRFFSKDTSRGGSVYWSHASLMAERSLGTTRCFLAVIEAVCLAVCDII